MKNAMRKGLQAAVTATMLGAATALSAGQAHAATGVTIDSNYIRVTAVAEKRNELFITRSGNSVRIDDYGDTVTAGGDCTQTDRDTVVCPYDGRTLLVDAKDLGDTVLVRGSLPSQINGGAGDDILTMGVDVTAQTFLNGNAGHDTIFGGPARDNITGGAGDDTMFGRDGNDRIDAGDFTPGNDRSYGDAGSDVCSGDVNDLRDGCES